MSEGRLSVVPAQKPPKDRAKAKHPASAGRAFALPCSNAGCMAGWEALCCIVPRGSRLEAMVRASASLSLRRDKTLIAGAFSRMKGAISAGQARAPLLITPRKRAGPSGPGLFQRPKALRFRWAHSSVGRAADS